MRRTWSLGITATAAASLLGCAGSGGASSGPRRAPAVTVGVSVPPEKFEEIDAFFRGKASQLQFTCYNPEVERTKTKYQGFVSLLIKIVPGGKAESVEMVSSSLKSPGIESCILEQARGWQWPEVPTRVPYNGTYGFKPAW